VLADDVLVDPIDVVVHRVLIIDLVDDVSIKRSGSKVVESVGAIKLRGNDEDLISIIIEGAVKREGLVESEASVANRKGISGVKVTSSDKEFADGVVKVIVGAEAVITKVIELLDEIDVDFVIGTVDVDVTIDVDVCEDVERVESLGALIRAESAGLNAVTGVLEGDGCVFKDARGDGSRDVRRRRLDGSLGDLGSNGKEGDHADVVLEKVGIGGIGRAEGLGVDEKVHAEGEQGRVGCKLNEDEGGGTAASLERDGADEAWNGVGRESWVVRVDVRVEGGSSGRGD